MKTYRQIHNVVALSAWPNQELISLSSHSLDVSVQSDLRLLGKLTAARHVIGCPLTNRILPRPLARRMPLLAVVYKKHLESVFPTLVSFYATLTTWSWNLIFTPPDNRIAKKSRSSPLESWLKPPGKFEIAELSTFWSLFFRQSQWRDLKWTAPRFWVLLF